MSGKTGPAPGVWRYLAFAAVLLGLALIILGVTTYSAYRREAEHLVSLFGATAEERATLIQHLGTGHLKSFLGFGGGIVALFALATGTFLAGIREGGASAGLTERKFRALLEQGLSGVIVYDAEHRILFHNAAARSLLEVREPDFAQGLAKRMAGKVVDAEGRPMEPGDHPLLRCFKEAVAVGPEIVGIRFENELRWFLVSASPVCDAAGRLEFVIADFLDYTAPREAERRLKRSEALLAESQSMAGMGSFEIAPDGLLYLSEGGRRILAACEDGLPGDYRSFLDRVHPDDRGLVGTAFGPSRTTESFEVEFRYRSGDNPGTERTLLARGKASAESDRGLSGYFRDVTEDRLSRERLLLSGKIFDNIVEGITITDAAGNILMVNRAFEEITGYSESEAIGQNPRILKSDHHDRDFYASLWDSLLSHGAWEGEIWNRRKDGTVFPEWLSISAVRNANNETTRYLAVFRDISDIKMKEAKIDRLHYHDALTDLPNRLLFIDRLETAMRMAERQGGGLAVLCLDLERFKYVNTSYGYRFGDKVLRAAAERVSSALRKADTVARVGGDEFLILLSNLGQAEAAAHAAATVLQALKRPLLIEGVELFLSATAGIAFWPSDGESAEALVAAANAALAIAKTSAPGRFHVYTPSIRERVGRRMELEGRLRKALEREEFVLHYQPRICARELQIRGAEALVRWRAEDGSLIPPGEFIPLAEETGLIDPLGEWVLRTALEEARRWREAGHDLAISVNLSARQFRERNIERLVTEALDAAGVPGQGLELEITESLAMADVGRTAAVLSGLSERGVQFSLDDFGTGYSSLYYLKHLPIQWLKIDQSFVRDLDAQDRSGSAIVSAIIAMAKSLGLGTIAEGCETRRSYDFLLERGCEQIQGYLFSRPLPSAQFRDFLAAGKASLSSRLD